MSSILLFIFLLIGGCATVANDWKQAQSQDTIQAYVDFLKKHKGSELSPKALERLNQLNIEKDWKDAQSKDTIQAYEDFLKKHKGSELSPKALERLNQLNIEKDWKLAQSKDTIQAYEDFLKKHKISEFNPKALERLNQLNIEKDWKDAQSKDNIQAYEDFITKHKSSELAQKADNRIEALKRDLPLWEKTDKDGSVDAYKKYILVNPQSPYVDKAKLALEDHEMYKKSVKEDWYSAYEKYIQKFPDGKHVQKAKERLSWLKSQKAIVAVDYPNAVEEKNSPYSNVQRPFWPIKTIFKEKGGKIGYKVHGKGFIVDPQGGRWTSSSLGYISGGGLTIPPGGKDVEDYWCSSADHALCNGYYTMTWTGEDAGGNPIEIIVKVQLKHSNCPHRRLSRLPANAGN